MIPVALAHLGKSLTLQLMWVMQYVLFDDESTKVVM
jgi:hypothetical protein